MKQALMILTIVASLAGASLAAAGSKSIDLPPDGAQLKPSSLPGYVTLPLFRVVLNPRFTRPFYAVPRTSAARIASG